MRKAGQFLQELSQNEKLPIRIVSPDFGHLPVESAADHIQPQQLTYYFILFVAEGTSSRNVDMETFKIGTNELIFFLPHQIQQLPAPLHGKDYFKIGFDEECLSRLPRQYPFLLNPFNQPKIKIQQTASVRIKNIFGMLQDLLRTQNNNPDLILAHLHSLLTEIDIAYFLSAKKSADGSLEKFINFKVFVENNLTDHPSVKAIAEELAISTDSLHYLVKQFSGLSPKEFITNRLILEARRRWYYGERTSIKELAFELGFNDPDYFTRVFKKVTGKTVAAFFQDLS